MSSYLKAVSTFNALSNLDFMEWMSRNGRSYSSIQEMFERQQIYNDNLILINSFNADTFDSAFYAPNKFADMTPDEFKAKMLMDQMAANKSKPSMIKSNMDSRINFTDVPTSWDWRDLGAVTSVKD